MTAPAPVILINGSPEGALSALDRGLAYGDGLFETIACVGGRARLLPWHLERLGAGCARLGFPAPDPAALTAEVGALAAGQARAIVKVLLTRGAGAGRGYAVSGAERLTRITVRHGWPDGEAAALQDGVRIRTAALRLGENPALAGIKHCNRLEQVLARREWHDPDIAEALLYSVSGLLVSGTMSNVFMVQDSRLRTPRIDVAGVAGVMRRAVLTCARRCGIACEEGALTGADLAASCELFLTNARIGIWPVRRLDERALAPGPMTRRLQGLLGELLERTDG
jgi:4-amino-4-deoxychorismate lyase